MNEYDFRRAVVAEPWFPEDNTHVIRLGDGTALPAMVLDLDPHMLQAGDPVAVVIRDRRAFILGKWAG